MTSTDGPALRPPLPEPVALRLRVDLFAHPERDIWREFEVRNDVTLDELHRILQVVMGWTDSHLHQFSLGADWFAHERPQFITPADAEEGEVGIHERDVRIDQILHNLGDMLLYLYDFGDDWQHKVVVSDVLALEPDHVLPRCLGGRYACPPENSGGAPGYTELMEIVDAALTGESLDEWSRERLGWLLRGVALPELPAAMETFDVDAVNVALRRLAR